VNVEVVEDLAGSKMREGPLVHLHGREAGKVLD